MPTAIRKLIERILGPSGKTASELRTVVFEYADTLGADPSKVPPALRTWVEKTSRSPYRITGADLDALRRAGFDDEAIFEITLAAATGAGSARYRRGIAALDEALR